MHAWRFSPRIDAGALFSRGSRNRPPAIVQIRPSKYRCFNHLAGHGGAMTTTTTTDFGSALNAAVQGGYLAQLNGGTYTITQPIVIHVTSTTVGPVGIDGGGATLVSQVTNGQPLIQIVVDPGVDLRYLTLSNFNIQGNGHEGDGIKIVCDTNAGWVYNWNVSNVTVQHVGGYGLDMQGSVFEGIVSNS